MRLQDMSEVVIVGGGQAGLAVSHELTKAGVEHLVLERGRVGETWRGRWDSFCLVTPNWRTFQQKASRPPPYQPDRLANSVERRTRTPQQNGCLHGFPMSLLLTARLAGALNRLQRFRQCQLDPNLATHLPACL